MDIVIVMVLIFFAQLGALYALSFALSPYSAPGNWLPEPKGNESKYRYEVWSLGYSAFWIGCFAMIVGFKVYETMDQVGYIVVCGGLALPLLLQPLVAPLGTKEPNAPLAERYSFKANVWILIFSHIGNYWYGGAVGPSGPREGVCARSSVPTPRPRSRPARSHACRYTHYFYTVLRAKYTMPSWRLNDVPIAMTFATHFYFTTYHTLSNMMLRKITTHFRPTLARRVFVAAAILAFSYFTAFMETFTISAYPDYSFEDRYMAYTVGSAFYGIYFIVSFPVRASPAPGSGLAAPPFPPLASALPAECRAHRPPTLRSSSGSTRAGASTRSTRRAWRPSAQACSCSSCSISCGFFLASSSGWRVSSGSAPIANDEDADATARSKALLLCPLPGLAGRRRRTAE